MLVLAAGAATLSSSRWGTGASVAGGLLIGAGAALLGAVVLGAAAVAARGARGSASGDPDAGSPAAAAGSPWPGGLDALMARAGGGGSPPAGLDDVCGRLRSALRADAVVVFDADGLGVLGAAPWPGAGEAGDLGDAGGAGEAGAPTQGATGDGSAETAAFGALAGLARGAVGGGSGRGAGAGPVPDGAGQEAEGGSMGDPQVVSVPGVGSVTVVPVHRADGVLGAVLVAAGSEGSVESPWAAALVALAAERVSVILERRHLQDLERRGRLGVEHARRHLALLVRAGDALAEALDDLEPALRSVGEVVVPMFADWFAVDVTSGDGTMQRQVVGADGDRHGSWAPAVGASADLAGVAHRHPDGDRLVLQVLRDGHPEMVVRRPAGGGAHLPGPDHGEGRPAGGAESMLVVPVRIRDEVVGAASFVTGQGRRGYRMSDLEVAEELAARIGIAHERVDLWHASRAAAERAGANEQRLQAVVEASPLAIVELDAPGSVVWCNAAARSLFCWPVTSADRPVAPDDGPQLPEDASGTEPARDRNPAAVAAGASGATTPRDASGGGGRCTGGADVDPLPVQLVWERACAGEAVVGELVMAPRLDGTAAQLSVSAAPLRGRDGAVTGALAMVEDVTERQRMLEQFHQAERLGAMARLAGGVAHDFNNLLTVILGSCELLLQRMAPGDPLVEEVRAITSAGQRAADLTSQLLSIGQRRSVQPVILDPEDVLRSMEQVVARVVGPDITVERVVSSEPVRILGEPAELERAVLNLALNARDAMDGSGHLQVGCRLRRGWGADGDVVEVWVSDTGGGMDAHTVEHCFEPFFTTKPKGSGTGLGLAGVHASVTQAGGSVSIRTQLGAGTTVMLAFPAVADALAGPGGASAAGGDELEDGEPGEPLVLVVDDDPDIRRLAVQSLVRHGFVVVAAADGSEALGAVAAAADRVELLVTDVAMPGMSGVELAARLVAGSPGLPVLYMSGNAGSAGLAAGADVLVKPFTGEELVRRARRALHAQLPGDGRPATA